MNLNCGVVNHEFQIKIVPGIHVIKIYISSQQDPNQISPWITGVN